MRRKVIIDGKLECSICHEHKPVGAFYRDRRASNGVKSWCKECYSKYLKNYKNERMIMRVPMFVRRLIKALDMIDKHSHKARENLALVESVLGEKK